MTPTRREVLEGAAGAAMLAAGDVSEGEKDAQVERLLQLAERDNEERWEYEAQNNLATIDTRLFYAELDAADPNPSATVQTTPLTNSRVPIDVRVETDDGDSISGLVHLSPDQTEALAVDLLEQALAARATESADDLEGEQ